MRRLKWISCAVVLFAFIFCLTGCFEACILGCNEGEITNAVPDPNELVEIESNGFGFPVWIVSWLHTAEDFLEAEIGIGKRLRFNPSTDLPLNKMDLSVLLEKNELWFVCMPMLPNGRPCMFHSIQSVDDSRQWNVRTTQDPPIWEGHYLIEDNTDMENLNGFSEVTGVLGIVGFDTLINLEPLNSLTSVGRLSIINNDSLITLAGLENLTSVGEELYIYDNDSLTNLTGLENITSVSGSIIIGMEWDEIGNDALISLEGLNNITSIDGNLEIHWNNSLMTLAGLENLTSVSNHFIIQNNPDLCTYLAEALEDQVVAGGGIGGDIDISGNKDCSSP